MRIGIFIVLMAIGITGFAQRVTLKVKDATLHTVFKEIRKQTAYDFLYNERLVETLKPVRVQVKNVSIEEALDAALSGLPLRYTIADKVVMVSARDTVVRPIHQYYSIRGMVRDRQGQPLPGAAVYVSNYKIATVADAKGNYVLKGLLPGNYTILVQMIGFVPTSQNAIIVDSSTEFDVVMDEMVNALKEVVVRPDYFRPYRLNTFKDNFLGTSKNARKCEILNPEVIQFEYDPVRRTLKGMATDFITIENRSLGYRIQYLLEYFEMDDETKFVRFYGYPYFEELEPVVSKRRRYAERRRVAYAGSPQHFFRSLYNNVNEPEGFVINKMIKVANAKRLSDSHIDRRIKFYSEALRRNIKVRHASDSLDYWIKMKIEPDTLEVLVRKQISGDSLIKEKSSPLMTMRFKDALYIVYKGEKESSDFKRYPEFKINRPEDLSNYQISLVYQLSKSVSFYENGGIYDPGSLLYEGVWAYKKVGDMLPMDYVVTEK